MSEQKKRISLELAMKLKEAGFKGECNMIYRTDGRLLPIEYGGWGNEYPAYDFLNDLCVTYCKELIEPIDCYQEEELQPWQEIVSLLRENKKEEAEKYFTEHCKLFKK